MTKDNFFDCDPSLPDALGAGIIHEEFKEAKELMDIVTNLVNIYDDQIAVELALERYLCEYTSKNSLVSHSESDNDISCILYTDM